MKKAILQVSKKRYTTNVDLESIQMIKEKSGSLEIFESDILIACIRVAIGKLTKKKVTQIIESINKKEEVVN